MAKTDWKNSDIVKPDDMNQIGQEINHLHTEFNDRLDMIKTSDITLQPGVQVIQAAKDARFRLGEVRGKTLVSPSPDLLGGKGNFESNAPITPFFNDPHVRRLDNGGIDNSKCLEIELTKTSGTGGIDELIQLARNKYYVAVAMIKNITTAQCAIGINGIQGAFVTSKEYTPAFLRFTEAQVTTGSSTRVGLMAQGSPGNTARMDNLRVYEISKADYDSLATMTAEQVAEKYPFGLIGIRGVDGPYAISTFDNLVPPLYEATILSTHAIVNPYELSMGVTDQTAYTVVPFVVQPNTDYTIKVEGDNFSYSIFPVDLTVPNPPVPWITSNARTFNSGDNTELRLLIRSSDRTKQAVFKKPMLVIGADAKPFKPQRKSMLAFQTELQANPVDGSDPDTLFEQNGQYFKLAKWKKVVLDGSLNWKNGPSTATEFKQVMISNFHGNAVYGSGIATKFNGKLIPQGSTLAFPDVNAVSSDGNFYISIPNADSGWGPDYTPTQDEIKAYFMGWKMTVQGSSTGIESYNNSGTKVWINILSWDGTKFFMDGATTTLPTQVSDVNYVPYQLLYRLVKTVVEPVVSEGALLLTEGDNMIEVGTGIVMRERANPKTVDNTWWYINSDYPGLEQSALKYNTFDTISVYKDSRLDNNWIKNGDAAFGKFRVATDKYDKSAAYSVTYLKLDKSPIVPIAGSLAANEKAQISDLTAGVAEALQRVSVVEQKKAEEDAPGWITPTLLNGWTGTVMYKKMSNGLVKLEGQAVPGAVGTMFRLPPEFRPSRALHFGVMSKGDNVIKMAWLAVDVNGDVNISEFASTWVGLDEVTYLAGQ